MEKFWFTLLSIILAVSLVACDAETGKIKPTDGYTGLNPVKDKVEEGEQELEKPQEDENIESPTEEYPIEVIDPEPEADRYSVQVVRVIDGDTIIVNFINDEDYGEERVRFLLVDTPETVKPNHPAEPFGPESSDFVKELLKGKMIELEFDVGDKRDSYDRLLAYLYIDGQSIQEMLLERGLARVAYIFPPNTTYLDEFRAAEQKAKEQRIGIWSIPGYATDRGFDLSVIDEAA